MRYGYLIPVLFLPVFWSTSTFAGSTITTNLAPSNVAIVNIDAKNDGAQAIDQNVWHSPFSSNNTMPQVTLPAGTYYFRIVNPTDALALNPSLTSSQQSQIYTGWTYNTPWIEDYFVFNSTALSNSAETQLFDGAPGASYTSAANAYAGALADGSYDDIRLTTRANPVILNNPGYVLATTTTLVFVIPDAGLFDNNGGVSVQISTVPEPMSFSMVFVGITLLGARLRVRK